jgi:hypothetical protein
MSDQNALGHDHRHAKPPKAVVDFDGKINDQMTQTKKTELTPLDAIIAIAHRLATEIVIERVIVVTTGVGRRVMTAETATKNEIGEETMEIKRVIARDVRTRRVKTIQRSQQRRRRKFQRLPQQDRVWR